MRGDDILYNYYGQMEKHKVFFSFYHYDDQLYKEYIDRNMSSRIINKSVMDGEYDPDNSDEYIKRLIREEKISDSSVVVVLIGPNTRRRKHVDWEIYAGLRASINGSSGLIGVLLPTFPLSDDGKYQYSQIPARLADNVKSGYAKVYTWEGFIRSFDSIIEDAFDSRITNRDKIDNSRVQMQRNLGGEE